jgi:hypothetical protein
MDDVASTSTIGGGHFHATKEGHTFWNSAHDNAVWKGLINTTWATKASRGKPQLAGATGCNFELLPDGHPSVID